VAYQFGDVLLVPVIFPNATGSKNRPVLVLCESDAVDLLVVPITTHAARGSYDVLLNDWQVAGLRLPSWARTSKLVTVAKSTVVRKMGELTQRDAQNARATLRRFFANIA